MRRQQGPKTRKCRIWQTAGDTDGQVVICAVVVRIENYLHTASVGSGDDCIHLSQICRV
jgi:hypothetical protein